MAEEQTFSDGEIVAIAVAAAAAVGGLVVALSRGQEAAEPTARQYVKPSKKAARETMQRARSTAGMVPPRLKTVPRLAGHSRQISPVRELALAGITAGMAAAADEASRRWSRRNELRPVVEDLRERAEAKTVKAGEAVSARLHETVLPVLSETSRQVGHRAAEIASQAEERFGHHLVKESAESVQPVEERRQDRNGSAGHVVGDTLAAVGWLTAASAVVYFVLMSPERREQVKDILCGAMEQARLLALDFKGYEPEY